MAREIISHPAQPKEPPAARRVRLSSVPINPEADYPLVQAYAWADMGRSSFYRLVTSGRGPLLRRRGRRVLIRGSDFLAWRDSLDAQLQ